jgi:predicted nucleotidyltransferase
LTPQELALVQKILHDTLPGAAHIWAFGSRAKGTAKRTSDLDLAIDMGSDISLSMMARLKDNFDEAPLAFGVDVIDLRSISPEFRALIDAQKMPLPGFEG